VIVTEKTEGAATVTLAEPDFPSTLAFTDADPGPCPVTMPSFDTDAIDASAVYHTSVLPVIAAPF
jgi:hypothetical protein